MNSSLQGRAHPRTQVCCVHRARPPHLAGACPEAFLAGPAGRRVRQVLHVNRQQQSSSTAHAGSHCVCRTYSTHNNRPPAQADAPPLERVPLEAVPAGDVHAVLHRLVLEKPAGGGSRWCFLVCGRACRGPQLAGELFLLPNRPASSASPHLDESVGPQPLLHHRLVELKHIRQRLRGAVAVVCRQGARQGARRRAGQRQGRGRGAPGQAVH